MSSAAQDRAAGSEPRPVRVGIVGLVSSYSVLFPPELRRLPGVRLVGAAHLGRDDRYMRDSLALPWLKSAPKTQAEYAAAFDLPLYERPEELYDAGVDAVAVCTEDYLRTRYAVEALRRGIHVFLPKPFAYTADDVRRLRDALAQSTASAMPALPLRYYPAYRLARELLTPEGLGSPVSLRAVVTHHLTAGPWKSDPTMAAGPEFESGFYAVDALCYLAGQPAETVYATAGNYFHTGIPPWDTAKAQLTFAGGAVASVDFYCGLHYTFLGQELEAVARDGGVRIERRGGASVLRVFTSDGERVEEPSGSGRAGELAEWLDVCRRGDRVAAAARFDDACRTLATLLAFQKACASGRIEAVEPL